MSPLLNALLNIAKVTFSFGEVNRATLHPNGAPESDTTHTVMLALAVMHLCPPTLSLEKALRFALVHDLPEVFTGDTNTLQISPEEREKKRQREAEGLQKLQNLYPPWIGNWSYRYLEQRDPEARFVRLLDKILPKLSHFLNCGRSPLRQGISPLQLQGLHEAQIQELSQEYPEFPELLKLLQEACELSVRSYQSHLSASLQGELRRQREDGKQYVSHRSIANALFITDKFAITLLNQMADAGEIRRAFAYYCPEGHTLAENMREEPTDLTCDECLLSYSRAEMYCKEKYFIGGSK